MGEEKGAYCMVGVRMVGKDSVYFMVGVRMVVKDGVYSITELKESGW